MMAKVLFKLNTLHIDIAIATNLKLQMKFYCGEKIRKTQKEQHLQKKRKKGKKDEIPHINFYMIIFWLM